MYKQSCGEYLYDFVHLPNYFLKSKSHRAKTSEIIPLSGSCYILFNSPPIHTSWKCLCSNIPCTHNPNGIISICKWEMRVGNRIPSETGRAGISTEDWSELRLKNMILSGSGVRLSCTIFCHFLGAWPLLWWSCVCVGGETPRAETEPVSQTSMKGCG